MLRTPFRTVALVLLAGTLVAACGASGGDDAAGTTSASKSGSTTSAAPTTEAADATETTEADDPAETAEADAPGDDICVPLKVLSDFDIESSQLVNGGDWAATQAYFVEHTDDVLAAYDEAIAMDSEVEDDLKALRAVTETTAETAADSTGLMDFSAKLLDQPGIMEAGAAGFALNTFAEDNCGFSTGGN
ncbi:MAG TPA: hypothetical protein VNQ33_03120 [Acidimicrobiales bacterium]|nr:hypothetical protein [Acidimicrobiales bacterium]